MPLLAPFARCRLLLLALLCGPVLMAHSVAAATAEPVTSNPEIQRRGDDLRKEIDGIYRDLKAKHAVEREIDVTPVLLKYIPIGMSFDVAEATLRAAGCSVGRHPTGLPQGSVSSDDRVDARRTLGRGFTFMPPSFFVSLLPRKRGDYTIVGNVRAAIIKAYI